MNCIRCLFFICLLVCLTGSAQTYSSLAWTDKQNISILNKKLTNTSSASGWGRSGAASYNKLYAGEDGFVSLIIDTLDASVKYMIGLSFENNNAHYNTINYALFYNYGKGGIFENGKWIKGFSLNQGDTLKVSRISDEIYYYHNSKLKYIAVSDSSKSLIVDAALNTSGGQTATVLTDIPIAKIITELDFSPSACSAHNGSIGVNILKGKAPYSFEWNNGTVDKDIANLDAGQYTVMVSDVDGFTDQFSVFVPYAISWENFTNCQTSGNVLQNTYYKNGWGKSGASSSNMLNANRNGILIIELDSFLKSRYMVGFSYQESDAHYKSIDYAFFYDKGRAMVYRKGVWKQTFYPNIGDQIRISRENDTIKFYQNNAIIYNDTTDVTKSLIIDASINTKGETTHPIYADFCKSISVSSEYVFAIPSKYSDGGFYNIENKILAFSWHEEYQDADQQLNYKIFNKTMDVVASSITDTTLPVSYGENLYVLNLSNDFNLSADKFYLLEITNEKNEKKYLRFYYQSNCYLCE